VYLEQERRRRIQMASFRNLSFSILALGVLLSVLGCAETQYAKEKPATGDIPYGKVVYVDDGTCPEGQVKEITGGSQDKRIPRTVRCVKRPQQ